MRTKRKAQTGVPAALIKGRRRFDAFRRQRRRRTPFPKALWNVAVDLAKSHGVNATARALGLDYYCVKKRLDAATVADAGGTPGFIELPPAVARHAASCLIEIEDGSGAKMRILLQGGEAPDVAGITGAFRRGAS
jgi:hypothetical protein